MTYWLIFGYLHSTAYAGIYAPNVQGHKPFLLFATADPHGKLQPSSSITSSSSGTTCPHAWGTPSATMITAQNCCGLDFLSQEFQEFI